MVAQHNPSHDTTNKGENYQNGNNHTNNTHAKAFGPTSTSAIEVISVSLTAWLTITNTKMHQGALSVCCGCGHGTNTFKKNKNKSAKNGKWDTRYL